MIGSVSGHIHICWTEPTEEVKREQYTDQDRWCFRCRKRVRFDHVIRAPIEISYYGPTHRIECTACGQIDGDMFPGREREWVEAY